MKLRTHFITVLPPHREQTLCYLILWLEVGATSSPGMNSNSYPEIPSVLSPPSRNELRLTFSPRMNSGNLHSRKEVWSTFSAQEWTPGYLLLGIDIRATSSPGMNSWLPPFREWTHGYFILVNELWVTFPPGMNSGLLSPREWTLGNLLPKKSGLMNRHSTLEKDCPVGWGCRIHRLHLCREVRLL